MRTLQVQDDGIKANSLLAFPNQRETRLVKVTVLTQDTWILYICCLF